MSKSDEVQGTTEKRIPLTDGLLIKTPPKPIRKTSGSLIKTPSIGGNNQSKKP